MAPGKRIARALLFCGLLLAVVLALWKMFLAGGNMAGTGNDVTSVPAAFSDPRLTYKGPYQNLHPQVAYVGSEACSNCHLDIAQSYARHPMGRSFLPGAHLSAETPLVGHHNPFNAFGAVFSVEARGNHIRHRQQYLSPSGRPVVDIDMEVHYTIGSGNHGHSFVTNRNGFLFQTPISWYSQKKIWDLSPGDYRNQRMGRHLSARCLFCHADRSFPVEGSLNQYHEPAVHGSGIGCERCHGPGERHVTNPGHFDAATGIDPTIVNPAKLPARLREAVCQQCHLEGVSRVLPAGRGLYDFRPGLPLESCWSVFVYGHEEGKEDKAVNHVEQMYLSRCFAESSGPQQMGCISCHDPHRAVPPAAKTDFFRARCLRCHGREIARPDLRMHRVRECTLDLPRRLSRNDSCFECHMSRYAAADVVHAASTDHRIIRGGPKALRPGSDSDKGGPTPSLVSFHRAHAEAGSRAAPSDRDLAFAQIEAFLAAAKRDVPLGNTLYALEEHLWRNPQDWPAWEQKAKVLGLLGRKDDALQDYKVVLTQFPDRETAMLGAARLARDLGLLDAAATWWQKLSERDPWLVEPEAKLTSTFLVTGSWEKALPHARAWVRLDPVNLEARLAYATCLKNAGHADQARREFAIIEELRPGEAKGREKTP